MRSVVRDTILKLAKDNKRFDGRELEEYRKIKIQINPIKNAEGSAYLELGDTKVLVGVKMDIGQPFPDKPDEGIQIVNAELTPIADPSYEPGPPTPEAIELARVVDRVLRHGKAIDMKDLVIKEGEKVWKVMIDIYVINNDGNLIDASLLAAMQALKNTYYPIYDEEKDRILREEGLSDRKLKLLNENLYSITIAKIGDYLFLDPVKREEQVADVILAIGRDKENIYSFQKIKEGLLTKEDILNCIQLSKKAIMQIEKQKWEKIEWL